MRRMGRRRLWRVGSLVGLAPGRGMREGSRSHGMAVKAVFGRGVRPVTVAGRRQYLLLRRAHARLRRDFRRGVWASKGLRCGRSSCSSRLVLVRGIGEGWTRTSLLRPSDWNPL